MSIDNLIKYLHKNIGHGEIQKYNHYDRYVKKPIRINKIIENEKLINELYHNVITTLSHKIIRTKSGAIQRTPENSYGVYDVEVVENSANNVMRGIIITIIIRSEIWVIKCGRLTNKEENTMTGKRAFAILKDELSKDKIDITKYAEKDGKKYKDQIDGYPIKNFILNEELNHVNHIDLVHAYPSNIIKKHPEFTKTFSRLDKSVLNSAIGYMQSKYCLFQYSKLSMEGINGTNRVILEMTAKMVLEGFDIIGYNTDGIWYIDTRKKKRLYHDENEGEGFGKWKHDYIDVKWYAQSDGQYYIIKDGKYEFKLRGYYQYETLKPRENWKDKEDFFKAVESAIDVKWDDKEGLIIRRLYD